MLFLSLFLSLAPHLSLCPLSQPQFTGISADRTHRQPGKGVVGEIPTSQLPAGVQKWFRCRVSGNGGTLQRRASEVSFLWHMITTI